MAFYRCGSGGGTLYDLVKRATVINAGTGQSAQSFTAEVGKRYLVMSIRVSTGTAGNGGISSGANVDTLFIDNQATSGGSHGKLWVAIVTATATTVTLLGTSNACCYMPLD